MKITNYGSSRELSSCQSGRTGDWERIRGPLAQVGSMTVPAVLWFAESNGVYSTLAQGRAAGNLADRPYFPPRALRTDRDRRSGGEPLRQT